MEKIGFIGLGIMGKPMSRNLLKAGYELEVFDISKDAVAEIVKAGAHACASPKEIAEKCWRSNLILSNGILAAFMQKAKSKNGFLLDFTQR